MSLHLLFTMTSYRKYCPLLLQKRKQSQICDFTQGPTEWDSVLSVSGSFYIQPISPSSFSVKLRWFIFLFTQQIFEHLHNTLGPAVYTSWTEYWGLNSVKNRILILQYSWEERQTQTELTSQFSLIAQSCLTLCDPMLYIYIYQYIMSGSARVQLRFQF